jgi:hypothetical protein
MKDIRSFSSTKYASYPSVADGVFTTNGKYITALCFQQEPNLGEGRDASDISQYPLEDILDRFSVYVSDFFKEMNTDNSSICYLEFTGFTIDDVLNLRGIIGKHVYNKRVREGNKDYIELVIE